MKYTMQSRRTTTSLVPPINLAIYVSAKRSVSLTFIEQLFSWTRRLNNL